MLDSFSVHPHLETPPQSASSALVPVSLVNHTLLTLSTLASILSSSSDASLEEPSASITSKDTIVFTRGEVSTHFARNIVQYSRTAVAVAVVWGTVVVVFEVDVVEVACYIHVTNTAAPGLTNKDWKTELDGLVQKQFIPSSTLAATIILSSDWSQHQR